MKSFILLAILGLSGASNIIAEDRGRDLSHLSGRYTFNFTDTDESAVVSVQFRRNKEQYRITDWLADGKMEDRIRDRVVTFSGAYVKIEQNGDVIVDAEFVRFRLTKMRLEWLPGYKHPLFKDSR